MLFIQTRDHKDWVINTEFILAREYITIIIVIYLLLLCFLYSNHCNHYEFIRPPSDVHLN